MILDIGYATLCPDNDILREIMSYDIINPVAVPFTQTHIQVPEPFPHMEKYTYYGSIQYFPSLHWSRQFEYPWAIKSANLLPHHTCLDAGGAGFSSFKYAVAKRSKHVTVVDLDEASLSMNEFYGKKMNINNISYHKNDISKFKFDYKFNRIFCISVLEHIEDYSEKTKCVKNMIDHLEDDGEMLLTFDIILKNDTKIYGDLDVSAMELDAIKPILDELGVQQIPIQKPLIGVLSEGTKVMVMYVHYKKQANNFV
jgi:2-polyprenyl-3-methyl-5-hydroxy-6-metoxy-1,4-benzoquinol methylase